MKLLLNHGNRAIANQQSLFLRKYDMSYILFTFLLFVTSSAFGQSMLMAKVSERNQVLLDGLNLLWLDPSQKFPVIGLTQEGDTIIQHSLGPIKNALFLQYRILPGGRYDPNLILKIKTEKSVTSSDAITGSPEKSTYEAEFENAPAGCYAAYQIYADGKPIETEIQPIQNNKAFLVAYLSDVAANSEITYEVRFYRAGLELKTAKSEEPW